MGSFERRKDERKSFVSLFFVGQKEPKAEAYP